MAEDELRRLRAEARADKKLFEEAAQVLAEIDRADGLSDAHADTLAKLRIRVEGKERKSLEDLLGVAGDISGKRDLGDVLTQGDDESSDWPTVQETKKDWPGL